MPRVTLLGTLRQIHLYFGVFITPAILFFAFSGALQTFGLHETNRDHPDYKPAHWIVVLGQLHKKQTAIVPVHRPLAGPSQPSESARTAERAKALTATSRPATSPSDTPASRPPDASPQPNRHPLPLRIFFLIVSIGLFTSTTTGLYMTWNYVRNKPLITLTLLAGIVLPLILVFV